MSNLLMSIQYTKYLVYASILIPLFLCPCKPSAQESLGTLSVNVTLEPLDGYTLTLELKNRSNDVLHFKDDVLDRKNLTLSIVESSYYGEPLSEIVPVEDGLFSEIILSPGDIYKKRIQLSYRFPDLESILKQRSVILFWSVAPQPIGKDKSTRFGGYLVIEGK